MEPREKAIMIVEAMCINCAFFEDCPEDYDCPPKEMCLKAAWRVRSKEE